MSEQHDPHEPILRLSADGETYDLYTADGRLVCSGIPRALVEDVTIPSTP